MENIESVIEEQAIKVIPMVRSKVDHEDVEDVMQDVRLAFFVSFPRFRGESELSTYSYGIAKRIVVGYFRKKYRDRHAQYKYTLSEVLRKRPEGADDAPSGWGFCTLSESEKAVLQLVGLGMNNDEIAEALYRTKNTVRSHMKEIYRKLQYRDRVKLALFSHRLFKERANEN